MAISNSTNPQDHAAAVDQIATELAEIDSIVSIVGLIDEGTPNAVNVLIDNAELQVFCNSLNRRLQSLFEQAKNSAEAIRASAGQAAGPDQFAGGTLSPQATLQSYQIACDRLSAAQCASELQRFGWQVSHESSDTWRVNGSRSLKGLRSMLAQEKFVEDARPPGRHPSATLQPDSANSVSPETVPAAPADVRNRHDLHLALVDAIFDIQADGEMLVASEKHIRENLLDEGTLLQVEHRIAREAARACRLAESLSELAGKSASSADGLLPWHAAGDSGRSGTGVSRETSPHSCSAGSTSEQHNTTNELDGLLSEIRAAGDLLWELQTADEIDRDTVGTTGKVIFTAAERCRKLLLMAARGNVSRKIGRTHAGDEGLIDQLDTAMQGGSAS